MLCEMQSVSSRIWTRVAVSISYDDNDYTTGTDEGYMYPFLHSYILPKYFNWLTNIYFPTYI